MCTHVWACVLRLEINFGSSSTGLFKPYFWRQGLSVIPEYSSTGLAGQWAVRILPSPSSSSAPGLDVHHYVQFLTGSRDPSPNPYAGGAGSLSTKLSLQSPATKHFHPQCYFPANVEYLVDAKSLGHVAHIIAGLAQLINCFKGLGSVALLGVRERGEFWGFKSPCEARYLSLSACCLWIRR